MLDLYEKVLWRTLSKCMEEALDPRTRSTRCWNAKRRSFLASRCPKVPRDTPEIPLKRLSEQTPLVSLLIWREVHMKSLTILCQRNFGRGSGVLLADNEKKKFSFVAHRTFRRIQATRSKDSLASTNPSPGSARVKLTIFDDEAHIALELIRETWRFL
jgi:hypothetical protein